MIWLSDDELNLLQSSDDTRRILDWGLVKATESIFIAWVSSVCSLCRRERTPAVTLVLFAFVPETLLLSGRKLYCCLVLHTVTWTYFKFKAFRLAGLSTSALTCTLSTVYNLHCSSVVTDYCCYTMFCTAELHTCRRYIQLPSTVWSFGVWEVVTCKCHSAGRVNYYAPYRL